MIKFPYYYTYKKLVIKHLLEKELAASWTVGILLFIFVKCDLKEMILIEFSELLISNDW